MKHEPWTIEQTGSARGRARRGERESVGRPDVAPTQEGGGIAAAAWRRPGNVIAPPGMTAAPLSGWHEAVLAAVGLQPAGSTSGGAALRAKPVSGEERASERPQAMLGAALIERELLRGTIALPEAGCPLARRRRVS